MTLLLRRSDIARLVTPDDLVEPLAHVLALDASAEPPSQRAFAPVSERGGAMVVFPGCAAGYDSYTVKVHSKFPGAPRAIAGVIHLHDRRTGELLAILESSYLTAARTAAGAVLAIERMSPIARARVAIIGAGVQGRFVAGTLARRGLAAHVTVYDQDVGQSEWLAASLQRPDLQTRVATSATDAAGEAEVVVLATWSHAPLLSAGDLSPGAHVTTLSCDQLHKSDVSRELATASVLVVDSRPLAAQSGILASLSIPQDDALELADVLCGTPRWRDAQGGGKAHTLYAPLGLPVQDLVAAWITYERAREAGVGTSFAFHDDHEV